MRAHGTAVGHPWVGPLVVLLFALVFIGVAYSQLTANRSRPGRAPGLVVGLAPVRGQNGTTWAPVVQWTDPYQRTTTFQSGSSSSPATHHEGQQFEVAFDPTGRKGPRIANEGRVMGPVFGVVGVAGVVGALAWLVALA